MMERRTLNGGMNNDDSPDFVPGGDYLVAHNCRVQVDRNGGVGSLKPLQSTVARTAGTTETTAVIGAINDDTTQRVFYFRWSSTGAHQILCWNRRLNTNLVVLDESDVTDGLGFGQTNYITSVALIGDYLYWCDGDNNEPRRIDVEKALKLNNPTYTSPDGSVPIPYSAPLSQWDITVARRVPIYAPKVEKLISADESQIPDRDVSYLDRNSIQFSVRYIYNSGEYSTVGPYSKIFPHNSDQRFSSYVERYDTIRVEIDKDELIDQEIRVVEFLARRDNVGSWFVVKSFDREEYPDVFTDHNTVGENAMGFYFYNDEAGIQVPDSESYVPFYDVPIYCNALEIANNRLMMFNNVKGYDYARNAEISINKIEHTWILGDVWKMFGEYYLFEWQCGTGLQEKVLLRIGEWFGPACGWYDTTFTSAQFVSGSLLTALSVDPNDKIHVVDNDPDFKDLANYLNPTCQSYTVTEYAFGQPTITDGLGSFSENTIAFRAGKSYKVGVMYYDYAGRNAGVAHDPVDVIIPERKRYEDTFTIGMEWTLGNDPSDIPLWAHSYSIVMNRAVEPFISGESRPFYAVKNQEDGTWRFDDGGTPPVLNTSYLGSYDGIGLNISRMTYFRGIGYTFSDGDVVKLINELDEVYYLKVITTYNEYLILELKDIGDTVSSYYEIITPKIEDENIYWEVGRNYKVLNPGKPNRSLSVPIGIVNGDTYFAKQENRPEALPLPAMNPSNRFWQIWPQNYGRPTRLLFSKQKRYDTDLHPSGPYFPGTETNQLNAFLSGENQQLDLAIGFGQRLLLASRTQEYGTVLIAIGDSEVASIYLGRTEFYNADETPNVLRSTDVIGTVNILKGGFGTVNPESCFKNDGNVYWFSAIKSAFVRYAKDGVNPISDKKMSTFAAWLGNLIMSTAADAPTASPIRVSGGFDDFHKDALWSIPPIGSWPIAYTILDATEDVTLTESSLGNLSASIQPGEIYRFSMTFPSMVTSNITVWDYFFGQKTLTISSASPSFMFVGRPGAPTTITVTTSPPLNTLVHGRTLERVRQYPYSAINRVPKTIAFNENSGRWSHTSSHTPEWFSKIGDQLITFRGGVLYTHDSSTSFGTFYGVQYPSWVGMVFNDQPNLVKRLQGITMETNSKPNYVHFRTEEPRVQSSDLRPADIKISEGIYSASALRDRLSPNTTGTVFDKLYRGDGIRGRYVKALIEWGKTINFATRIINLITRPSNGHKT